MSRKHRRADETVEAHEAAAAPPDPEVLVEMRGVALINRRFVMVKATIPVEETIKSGREYMGMEYAYDELKDTLDNESLARSRDRYKAVTR